MDPFGTVLGGATDLMDPNELRKSGSDVRLCHSPSRRLQSVVAHGWTAHPRLGFS